MQSWSKTLVRWRWEFLADTLNPLLVSDRLETMLADFDLGKIVAGDDIDAAFLKGVDEAKRDPSFLPLAEAFRVIGNAVNREMMWFDGCECHKHIWTMPKVTFSRKVALLKRETGFS
eukprot:3859307-Alexandrium_andersonii.AAC.1